MSDNKILSASDRFNESFQIIEKTPGTGIQLGVSFLDQVLIGVLPTDLVLVGAASGVGKTTLLLELAKSTAIKNRKVLFIALEAEKNEIEMRLTYQLLAQCYFADKNRPYQRMDYRSFRFGNCQLALEKYRDQIESIYHTRYKTLYTQYKSVNFTIENLKQIFLQARGKVDAIFIDHFHYFDFMEGSSLNENQSQLIKGVRELNLEHQIPVVMAVHLRKGKSIIPTMDDIMGSSDIGKVATIHIMVSKDPDGYDPVNNLQKTYFSIPKTRTGAFPFVGVLEYSINYNCYTLHYNVGRLKRKKDEDTVEALQRAQLPDFIKSDEFCQNK